VDDPVETDTSPEGIVMRNRPVYDVVALLARCGVGAVFLAHGWQKIQVGITATGRQLDAQNVPLPTAAAVYSTFAELLGGVALILGIGLPVAGTLLFLDMAGAFAFVHVKHGLFLVNGNRVHNGFELVLVLGLASLIFASGGGGRLTLDRWLFGRERNTTPDDENRPFLPDETQPAVLPAVSGLTPPPPPPMPIGPEPSPLSSTTRPDIITDTTRDVIVAGRKPEPPPSDTGPTRAKRKQF
jgi:putative oxidoreductase